MTRKQNMILIVIVGLLQMENQPLLHIHVYCSTLAYGEGVTTSGSHSIITQ